MNTNPLNKALRDHKFRYFTNEVHLPENALGLDGAEAAYEQTQTLLNKLFDWANSQRPEPGSREWSPYDRLFRCYWLETPYEGELFLFQNDTRHEGDTDAGSYEYRLIWRNWIVNWYKHPRRALQANWILSEEEQLQLFEEFQKELLPFLQNDDNFKL